MNYEHIFLKMLRFYPKRFGSKVVGWIASCKLPVFLRAYLLGKFVKAYRINMAEAEYPLVYYSSLQSLFSRRLKAGVRRQGAFVPGAINSPADGELIAFGSITSGLAIQAKGLPYRIEELLKHDLDAKRFDGGYYLTIYLSPKDYHRVHVPLFGNVKTVSRVEGELWPVNKVTATRIFRLYERNRRVAWVAEGSDFDEGLEVAVVLVGATHVGKIIIDQRWLNGQHLPLDGILSVAGQSCQVGEDLGAFQFGSTVVLLIGGPKVKDWQIDVSEGEVLVGQRLGKFVSLK